jgi:hypothetical protein
LSNFENRFRDSIAALPQKHQTVKADRDAATVGKRFKGGKKRLVERVGFFSGKYSGGVFLLKTAALLCSIGKLMVAVRKLYTLMIDLEPLSNKKAVLFRKTG